MVTDASAVLAALADDDDWALGMMRRSGLSAPAVMPFEVGEVLQRRRRQGQLDGTAAALAHRELLGMRVDLWPHEALAGRAWELRENVSYSDACYVALAELLDAPLVTLDRRLARAPGPRCAFLTPPGHAPSG